MSDCKLDQFIDQLCEEFPAFRVVVLDHTNENDPTVGHFVHVLDVPSDRLCAVEDRCWELALEIYGDESLPFLVTAVSPVSSAKYFSETDAVTCRTSRKGTRQ